MIRTNIFNASVSPGHSDVHAGDPLTRMAYMMRLEKGKNALMDLDSPAFVRSSLRLGLPESKFAGPRLTAPAPISRLLNIVLGQDGILFPIEEP